MNTATRIAELNATSPEEDQIYLVPENLVTDCSYDSLTPIREEIVGDNPAEAEVEIKPPKYAVASPYATPLKGRYKLLQQWEGHVKKVSSTEIEAIIKDKTNPDMNDELITFDIEELSPGERPLAEPGAVFYWSIGYSDYPGRGRKRESQIRFRRLRCWTQKELERAKQHGIHLAELFSNDSA